MISDMHYLELRDRLESLAKPAKFTREVEEDILHDTVVEILETGAAPSSWNTILNKYLIRARRERKKALEDMRPYEIVKERARP